ncbi:MAG TPA: PepSY-associated TM helix domain-containing protein [Abditibacteriaceae bacterium]|jgi:uncharacterized iron-regulated membrane protein
MWRKACLTVHLWVGLTLGALAAVSGLSGSAMVFGPELEAWLHPHAWHAAPHAPNTKPVGMQAAADALRQAHPTSQLQFIRTPLHADGVYEAWLDEGALRVTIDPYSGHVLSSHHATQSLLGWMYFLHTELFSSERGAIIMGWGGIGLFVLSLTGIVVWWPRKGNWRAAVSWQTRTVRRPGYQLHRFVGWLASLFLCIISMSGVALVFPEITTRVLESVFEKPQGAKPKSRAQKSAPDISLDAAISSAQQVLPGARVTRVAPPTKASAPIVVRLKFPAEIHPNGQSNVFIDRHSGRVLRADDARTAPQSARLMNLRYPLHIGRWGGNVSRVLHALLGFVPAVLYITGLLMWGSRLRGRRKAQRVRQERAALAEVV